MKLKKKLILIFTCMLLAGSVSPLQVWSHPGRTDGKGCHTCRTNCEKWGRRYGEYHCHNPKRSDTQVGQDERHKENVMVSPETLSSPEVLDVNYR